MFKFDSSRLHDAARSDLADYLMVLAVATATGAPREAIARDLRASDRVVSILRSPIGLTDAPATLVPGYGVLSMSFIEALKFNSVFDRMLADGAIRNMPPRTSIVVNSFAMIATETGAPGTPTPLAKLELDAAGLPVSEVTAICAFTNDLLRSLSPAARTMIEAEMRAACGAACDLALFAAILDSSTPEISATSNVFALVWRDALAQLPVGASSRIYAVCAADVAKKIAGLPGPDDRGLAFAAMSPMGGSIGTTPALVCGALAEGEMLLIDADSIAGNPGDVDFSSTSQADLQMRSDPSSAAADVVSLWGSNSTAMKVVRRFAAAPIRAGVVRVTDLNTIES